MGKRKDKEYMTSERIKKGDKGLIWKSSEIIFFWGVAGEDLEAGDYLVQRDDGHFIKATKLAPSGPPLLSCTCGAEAVRSSKHSSWCDKESV